MSTMPSSSIETCYFCGAPATSKEHVPPKCIFPEKKDLGIEANHRENLLKVPSCEIHNLRKSRDDEYLLAILSMNCDSNKVGQRQAATKLVRAFQRSEGFRRAAINDPVRRLIFDRDKRLIVGTAALTVDRGRLKRCFEHIGRGLYYHHYGKNHFTGSIDVKIEFSVDSGVDLLGESDHPQRGLRAICDQGFAGTQKHGANPQVFYYQILHDQTSRFPLMRLVFYEGSCATLIFG